MDQENRFRFWKCKLETFLSVYTENGNSCQNALFSGANTFEIWYPERKHAQNEHEGKISFLETVISVFLHLHNLAIIDMIRYSRHLLIPVYLRSLLMMLK